MIQIKEAILVEGRYDVNKVKQIFDTVVIETSGFSIFNDENKAKMIKNLAEKHGLIVLTDSDGGGLVIRNYIRKILPKDQVKHAYIPEIIGKEKRKRIPGKENLLGVEGVQDEVIIQAVLNAGATLVDPCDAEERVSQKTITKSTLYFAGLSGCTGSAELRKRLLYKLELPSKLSTNALIEYCNCMFSEDEFLDIVRQLNT